MKTSVLRNWTVVGLSVLTTAAVFRASADEAATAKPERTYTGMVKSVDADARTVTIKSFLSSRHLNLGESCEYSFANPDATGIADVRPGQKVTVSYKNVNGVLVADHLTQRPLLYKGKVKSINPEEHTITVGGKTFHIADGCAVVLLDNKSGTLADVEPDHLVTIRHENPNGVRTARQIAQTSDSFTGSLTAIDLTDRTIKARATFGSKEFHLANNCAILVNGQPAQMNDLKPGDKLVFSFDSVDGVNVATRIAPANGSPEPTTAQAR
jgi:Cu/Ag efflux protein CusF